MSRYISCILVQSHGKQAEFDSIFGIRQSPRKKNNSYISGTPLGDRLGCLVLSPGLYQLSVDITFDIESVTEICRGHGTEELLPKATVDSSVFRE